MTEVSVPVIVDSVKDLADFPLTRCTYYTIEADDLSAEAAAGGAGLANIPARFIVAGLSGVLCAPSAERAEFDSADVIEETFQSIEADQQLAVETDDIWLPNELLFRRDETRAERKGRVFRIGLDLFVRARRFRRDIQDAEAFLAECHPLGGQVLPSKAETEAFREWSERQRQAAIEAYQKAPDRALPWHEAEEPQ